MNTTAGRTQDREKLTQMPGIQTFFRPGYPIFTGDCDSSLKVDFDCCKNRKSTINGTTLEEKLEKLSERQDSLSTPEHEYDVCITCNKHLSKQVAVHNRTFSSGIGDELFMQKGNLLIHKDQIFFTCTTCARIFPKRTHLSTHIRIHISDKPYSSESCSRSFSPKTTLNSHIRIHTGEKTYLFTICGKRYGHSSTLLSSTI